MRSLIVLVLLGACYSAPSSTTIPPRPLVTDQLSFGRSRAEVRAWFANNDWCQRRTWEQSDEFVVCDPRPYLDRRSPPMYTIVRYRNDRVDAYAVFTPVPCRLNGQCDRLHARTVYAGEHDFVDHDIGLLDSLAARGRAVEPHGEILPSMQQRMLDALAQELVRRYGEPSWYDPTRYGMTWDLGDQEIGLFVVGDGRWIAETHELVGRAPRFSQL